MRNYFLLCLFGLTTLLGCTELIRVDSETYMQNPGMYEGKYTLISADLEEVVENHQLYEGLDLEIAAPITHFEERDAPSWFLILEKNGKMLKAYERSYLRFVPPDADYLARWAKREGGDVTARGKLMAWGMELDHLAYRGLNVKTNSPSSQA
jgi:hypothetical protein